jgi:RTX calcium-binding nonapeptide repeat (4 copies)
LPSWLNFNPNTRTFSGKSPGLQAFEIKLTATDKAGATAIDNIPIRVTSSGVIIDAYIAGATVFFDANKNSIFDTNEPSTITDANGEYELDISFETFDKNRNGQIDPEEGNIVAVGGFDTATGLPLETPVSAPPDSTVVTLLTTLVADLMGRGISQNEAESKVKVALAIPASVDLTDLDPIVATKNSQPGGVETLAAMVKVQNLITQTATFIDGISTAGYPAINKAVVSAIASQIQSGTKLDLTNPAQLSAIIQQAVTNTKQFDSNLNSQKLLSIAPPVAQVMAEANQKVDRAISNFLPDWIPAEVARVQKVALSDTAIDFKQAAAGIKPISEVVAENTGTALDAKIQGITAPEEPATPIATGDIEPISDSINSAVGTNGDDTLIGSNANDFISGKRGNDSLDGSLGDDTIYGGKGGDTLIGGNGEDILFGDRGSDSLIGGDGNDTLYGGKGNDTLIGGLGNDCLIGGALSDYFVLSADGAIDTIVDFEDGKDLLFLTNGLTFAQLDVGQTNNATLIKLASNGQVLASLTGISANTINATDFAF